MCLVPSHVHHGYFYTNDSDPTGGAGTTLTSSASTHTYGTWTQIGPTDGLAYASSSVLVELNTGFTAATTRNSYVDIGIGPDSSNVTVIVEKLCGSGATGNSGKMYYLPLRIPPDVKIWARTQHTTASGTIKINISVMGGNQNPGTFPTVSQIVCLGAVTASTTGTAITIGASGAEGAWTQIVASTTDDYAGLMIGGPFYIDTNMTAGPSYTFDASVGGSGSELTVGENLTKATIFSAAEDWVSWSVPTMLGIPAAQRLCIRGSCSAASESSISVVLYAFKH
jgi:hypothetical protein